MIRVLLMDDEIHICKLLRKLIKWEDLGFTIIDEAHDGIEGLEKARELAPDLVIIDIGMPGMDGLSLIDELQKMNEQIYFIIVSGHKDFEYAKTALAQGVKGYLLKPVSSYELESVLLRIREDIAQKMKTQQEIMCCRTMINDNRRQLLDHFFRKIIAEKMDEPVSIERLNCRYGCQLREGNYRVVIYKLDPKNRLAVSRKPNDKEVGILKSILIESFSGKVYENILLQERSALLEILNYSPDGDIVSNIREIAHRLNYVCGFEEYNITVGVGIEIEKLDMLTISNKVAHNAINRRIKLGTGIVIEPYIHVHDISINYRCLTTEEKSRLSIDIEISNCMKAKNDLEIALKRIADECDAPADSIYWVGYDSLNLIKLVYSKRLAEQFDFNSLIEQLDDCFTTEQIVSLFYKTLVYLENAEDKKDNRAVEIAKEYVSKHYCERIQIKDVAGLVYLTPNYFSDLFRQETGMNFSDFLCQYRLNIAKDMLINTCERVNDVGLMVGYHDPKNFSKQFKKRIGISPAKFRKIIK